MTGGEQEGDTSPIDGGGDVGDAETPFKENGTNENETNESGGSGGSSLFSDISEETVFRSRTKLSDEYTPDIEGIKERDDQLDILRTRFKQFLVEGVLPDLTVFKGPNGTGKTLLSKHLSRELMLESDDLYTIHANCATCSTEYQVAIMLANLILPEHDQVSENGLNKKNVIEKLFRALEEHVEENHVLINMDEVGSLPSLSDILYQVSRSNQSGTILDDTDVGVITTSNSLDWYNKMKQSRRDVYSSLDKDAIIEFPPYNATELSAILEDRAKKAFVSDGIEEGAWKLAAARAGQNDGDARYGIELLRRAGKIASNRDETTVDEGHINAAQHVVDRNWIDSSISGLSPKQQLPLVPLVEHRIDPHFDTEHLNGSQIHTRHQKFAEKWGYNSFQDNKIYRQLREYTQKEITETTDRGRAKTHNLVYDPERYLEVMDEDLVRKILDDEDIENDELDMTKEMPTR